MPMVPDQFRPPRIKMPRDRAHYQTVAWAALRRAVLLRDGYRCAVCRRLCGEYPQVDHIVPRSQGGTDDLSNLQTLCLEHHGQKTRGEQRRSGHGSR
jgi:5-methylcytosine-specific restriction endonuclease McrA